MRRFQSFLPVPLLAFCLVASPAPAAKSVSLPIAPATVAPLAPAPIFSQQGLASRYRATGRSKTANGEVFLGRALTGAHRSLPFGTVVRVTDVKSGRSVKLRINDRGPFAKTRIIDLSTGAARALGMKSQTQQVRLEVFAADQSPFLQSGHEAHAPVVKVRHRARHHASRGAKKSSFRHVAKNRLLRKARHGRRHR
jgi:rare lipoprotein A